MHGGAKRIEEFKTSLRLRYIASLRKAWATDAVGVRSSPGCPGRRVYKGRHYCQDKTSKSSSGTVRLPKQAGWSMPKMRLRASTRAQFVGFLGAELNWGKGDSPVTGFL